MDRLPNYSFDSLSIMSLNIRFDDVNEKGPLSWENRSKVLERLFRFAKPDIICLQEVASLEGVNIVTSRPTEWIDRGLNEYGWIGRESHDDFPQPIPILYLSNRFSISEDGYQLLPLVEDQNFQYQRRVVWARIYDTVSEQHFYVYNTHLRPGIDLNTVQARERSALKIIELLNSPSFRDPVILTGDMNAVSFTNTIRSFEGVLKDVQPRNRSGTYHGFLGLPLLPKIDYIFVSPNIVILDASILTFNIDGIFPSDHYPISAQLLFAEK